MKKWKRFPKVIILLIILLALSACSRGGSENNTVKELSFAFELPESHPWGEAAKSFKEEVEKESNGTLKINLFPNGSLAASGREIQEGTKIGTVDIGISSTPLSQLVPELDLFSLPYLFNNRQHAWDALDSEIGKEIGELLSEHNLVFLSYWEDGFRQITTKNKGIKEIEDFKGLKIRVPESDLRIETFKALGATPISMPWSEVFTALQQGAIDGQENPLSVVSSASFYDVQENLIISNHVYSPATVFMNENKWSELSESEKEIITNAINHAKQLNRDLNEKADEELKNELEKKGMIVSELTDRESYRKATEGVWKAAIEKIGDKNSLEEKINRIIEMGN